MPSFFEDPTTNLSDAELARARKAEQARRNGALSTGPRTAEGKKISSANARKHGFASANPILNIEDREAWEAHLASYIERFQPADQPEADAVRRAALAMWKLDRIAAVEAALFNLEFEYHQTKADALFEHNSPAINRMAIALKESAGDRAFDLCRRYHVTAGREHDHAIRTFYLLESKRLQRSAAPVAATTPALAPPREPNEPTVTRPFSPSSPLKIASTASPKPARTAKSGSRGRHRRPKSA